MSTIGSEDSASVQPQLRSIHENLKICVCDGLEFYGGSFVEFSGEVNGNAELLMSIASHCMLQESHSSTNVLYITDNVFDMKRFATIVQQKALELGMQHASLPWSKENLISALDNFHLYYFKSMNELFVALLYTFHSSLAASIGAVIIDSSFVQNFWEHRGRTNKDATVGHIVNILKKIVYSHRPVIFFSHPVPVLADRYFQRSSSLKVHRYKTEPCRSQVLIKSVSSGVATTHKFDVTDNNITYVE